VEGVPVEAECLTPALCKLTAAEIELEPVWVGNRQELLGAWFAVSITEDAPDLLRVEGDCSRVKWIGKSMTGGRLELFGPAGMHLGAYMSGGEIECYGDAGDWAGAMMTGGRLHIHGNAGNQLGAGYRGEPFGMADGVILVDGSAGVEAGAAMGRGLIVVRGDLGDFAGAGMHAGTILCGGRLGIRPGINMEHGSIVALGPAQPLPTFRYTCDCSPVWLRLLARQLAALGVPVDLDGEFRLYAGDMALPGKGEVLVWHSHSA
jgi:formylmethanofuran dehydrogenase subunit C